MNQTEKNMKGKFLKLVLAFTLLTQPFIQTAVDTLAMGSDVNPHIQQLEDIPADLESDDFFNHLETNPEVDEITDNVNQTEHPPIEELYEQLREHDRVYSDDGGFYELVPVDEVFPDVDVEDVIESLNSEDGYALIDQWALINVEGEILPSARTHVVRYQRTIPNTSYHFGHIPGHAHNGVWQMTTWQLNIGGNWIRAFCTDPGIPSATAGNNNLSGWNPSETSSLNAAQRRTIAHILQHGYRNIVRHPEDSNSAFDFSSEAVQNDAIVVTQIMIFEVVLGDWRDNNITSGRGSSAAGTGAVSDMWRRLIATDTPIPSSRGVEGFRASIGSTRRMNMYDAIRHDMYFFQRRNGTPAGTSSSSSTSARPLHTLQWSNTHNMFRTVIDDRVSQGGTGTLNRFMGSRTSGSLGSGYRFCRGTQSSGVCNPSVTSNQLIIYTTNGDASAMNSPADFLRWNPADNAPSSTRNQAVAFFVNPNFQNKVLGTLNNPFYAHFRVEVEQPSVRARIEKRSTYSQAAVENTVFRIQALGNNGQWQTPGNAGTATINTLNSEGILTSAERDALPGSNVGFFFRTGASGNRTLISLEPGQRYRIQEVYVPEPYILGGANVADGTWHEFTASPRVDNSDVTLVPSGNVFRQYNDRALGQIVGDKSVTRPSGSLVPENVSLAGFVFRLERETAPNSNTWETVPGIADVTTNSNGDFLFNNIPLGVGNVRYRVTEIYAPAPWIISDSPHQIVTLGRADATTAVITREVSFVNDEVVGEILVTKYGEAPNVNMVGSGRLENVEFALYRETTSGGGGWTRLGTSRTNSTGQTLFSNIALTDAPTNFRVCEIDVPAPWIISDPCQTVVLTRVDMNTAVVSSSIVFTNEQAYGEITVEKTSETGVVIPGTIFELTGNGINLIAVADEYGHAVFTNLPLGSNAVEYTIIERYVPSPYLLDETPMVVGLSRTNNITTVTRETVEQVNDMARGRLRITKLGETIVGFEDYVSEVIDSDYTESANPDGLVSRLIQVLTATNPDHLTPSLTPTPRQGIQWIMEDLPLEGVTFHIYAYEDIVLDDGTIVYTAGEFVGAFITDSNGEIESDDLFLGEYFVQEVSAPNGFIISDVELRFSLTYEDMYTAIVFDELEVTNQWQEVEVRIIKVGEVYDYATGYSEEYIVIPNVHFGLFAGEDFTFLDGSVLTAGSLIEDAWTDANGEIVFSTRLPLGTFYVQEIAVDEFYVIDDTRHYFTFVGENQEERLIVFDLTEFEPIRNNFVRGSFELIKYSLEILAEDADQESDSVDGYSLNFDEMTLLPKVEFELWTVSHDEPYLVGTFVTDENGRIFIDDLIWGDYKLIETVAHYRHQLLSEPIYFSIRGNHEHLEIPVANYQTQTQILKVDDLGIPLEGAHFQLIFEKTGEVVHEWISSDRPEVINALAHGSYILRETESPEGFLLMDDIRFEVTDAEEILYITAINELDARAYIATQAHTSNGSNQYFWIGDTVNMHDDIRITHYNIRPGSPMAFEAFLHARFPDGSTEVIWQSGFPYTVENVEEFNVNTPNESFFTVNTEIDTSEFPAGTEFFWSESLYKDITTDEDEDTVLDHIYDHNKDGSDGNQTLYPRDVLIATQAHTGDNTNQYFTPGETVRMFDNIRMEHINLIGEEVRVQGFLFHRLPDGTEGLSFESEYIYYTVENIVEYIFNAFETHIDTSDYPTGTVFFWAERIYKDYEDEWKLRYEHNLDGSDQNQMFFPIIETPGRLPQTGAIVLTLGLLGLGFVVVATTYKYNQSKKESRSK